jgi:cyclic pyranopterin phosphate synthase
MDDRPKPRPERRRLSHVDRGGRPRMVDVSEKAPTSRRAVAEAEVGCSQETLTLAIDGGGAKGDILTVAELAGVMAAKRTADLIPLCHPLPLTDVVVRITPDRAASAFRIHTEAATTAPTGVEMEALTAASVAALTLYDMIKGVEKGAEIRCIRLVAKSGGKSGEWHRPPEPADTVTPRGPRQRAVRGPSRAGGTHRSTKKAGS